MSTDLTNTASVPRPFAFAHLRTAGLIALLLSEVLVLGMTYDTEILRGETHWAATFFGYAPLLAHPGLTIIVVALLFGGTDLLRAIQAAALAPQPANRRAWAVAGHLGCYGALFLLTGQLLGGQFASLPYPTVAIASWLAACAGTFGFWLAAMIAPAEWWPLARRGWKALLVGAVVGVAAWFVGDLTRYYLWRPMAQGTMWITAALLGLVSPDVAYRPAELVIGTPSFTVTIWPACSGYEGIGLIWVFLGAYLWLFRHTLRFPQALLLLPIGTAVIWLANALRITALILIGEHYSYDVAMGGFHSQAGSFAFAAIGLAMVVGSQRLAWFSNAPSLARQSSPAAPYVMPLIALIGTMMLTRAVTEGFDALYPLRFIVVAAVLWIYWGRFRVSSLEFRVTESAPHSDFRLPTSDLRPRDSALRTPHSALQFIPAALMGAVVFAMWMALERLLEPTNSGGPSPSDPTHLPPLLAGVWLVFRVLGSVVTVPIAEELAFRGFLMRRLVSADFERVPLDRFTWISFVASSAAFGALHGRWLAGTLAGMLFALIAYRRGRLSDAIVAHATANALIAGYVLTTGNWNLW